MRFTTCLAVLAVAAGAAASTGCSSPCHIPSDVIAVARQTKPGGQFFIEFDEGGSVVGADADIDVGAVPANIREIADREFPGGEQVAAEREYGDGEVMWEVVKKIDGRLFEILITDDGKVVGGEEALAEKDWPAAVADGARAAVPGANIEALEKVWGPEAHFGEAYHVKFMKDGDSLRVGVDEGGKVVRVVRRIPGQVRIPR